MGFLYRTYADRTDSLKEILHLPHTVYIASPPHPCCKQRRFKKIDIYFSGFLFDCRKEKIDMHILYVTVFITRNANKEWM